MTKEVNNVILHGFILIFIRGDYKTGWQLEREHDEQQKTKLSKKLKSRNEDNDDDDDKGEYYVGSDDEDDGLPFVCLKCKDSFVNPVSTKYLFFSFSIFSLI